MPFNQTSVETFASEFATTFLQAVTWQALIANAGKNREALVKHIHTQMNLLDEAVCHFSQLLLNRAKINCSLVHHYGESS